MKKKAKVHPFLKMAGVKTEKEFYDKYPTDEHFFEAHPQAKYGMMLADAGLNLPGGAFGSQGQSGLSAQDTMIGLNAAGSMGQQGGYAANQGPVMDLTSTPKPTPKKDEEETDETTPPLSEEDSTKKPPRFKFGKTKTWKPWKDNNAWNTGTGVNTTDIFGTAAAVASGILPFQPKKMNRNPLQQAVTVGNYGTGSHAAFEDGGQLSPTKARMMLHDGTVHGHPITEKQRKYFGAVASGYAADGGPMITEVVPSAHTYFRPMTRQGRQVPETPNFIAEDGMSMPVTDADRQAYNNYVIGMRKLPGYDSVNWQHDQNFQKQAAQQLGFDYSKAAAIQADMKARNEAMPGTIKGIQPGDAWGGDPTWVGNRERQKEYIKHDYTHIDSKGNVNYIPPRFTPLTQEEYTSWTDQNRARIAPQTNLPPTTNPMDPAYVAPGTPAAPVSRETGLAATGFPTREEALAKYNARKASGQELPGNYFEKETRKQRKAKETGDPIGMVRTTGEDVYKYGGPILGAYDARLNQDYPYPMTDHYPHKIGGNYHPYDHTRMEAGGIIPIGEHGLQVEGNQFRYLSPNTVELVGPKHKDGGIDIAYNGNRVEAEGGETFHIDGQGTVGSSVMPNGGAAGDGIVGGNLYVPNTNTKFKDAFKDVAKMERKTSKLQDKASKFLNEFGSDGMGAYNKYQAPAFNYGSVMSDAYEQNKAKDEQVKTALTETQNRMLELGGMIDPENGAKKVSSMFKGTAKWGTKMMAKKGKKITGNLSPTSPNLSNTGRYNDAWSRGTENFTPAQSGIESNIAGLANYAINNQGPSSTVIDRLPVIVPTEHPVVSVFDPFPTIPEEEEQKKEEKKTKGLRNKFRISDYIPEIAAGLERAEPYQSMQVQPFLEPDQYISFQNEKNAIQSAFGPALNSAKTPAQKAAISAQMAEQLANVDAKEMQFNQQNKGQILGRNLGEMRGVRDTNLKLAMDAYDKTLGGKEAARAIRQAGARSLSGKEQARRAKNLELGMYEDYAGWAYNPEVKQKWEMLHPGETFDPRTVSIADLWSDDEKKTTKKEKTDSKGKESKEESVTITGKYYGGPMAYFGEYMPVAPVRRYPMGGAMSGGPAMGGGMHGMPGMQGNMASRYFPGGADSSYYQKKKRKKKN